MEAELQAHVAFFLSGRRMADQLDEVSKLDLRPALFSGLRDLTKLRYDFPLLLVHDSAAENRVLSLSGLNDAVLDEVAQGGDADRVRKHLLRLEQDIRTRLAERANNSSRQLSALWDEAAAPLAQSDKLVADSLGRARAALKFDGELVDCDAAMPARLLQHLWGATQTARAKQFGRELSRLMLKLSDILKADFVKSDAGKSAQSLKASFGSGPMDAFDFEMMSRLLKKSIPKSKLPKSRRLRVEHLISVLGSQKFFPAGQDAEPYAFFFESVSAAQKAYVDRLPKAIALAKAVAIAELEIKGEYDEAKHDALFEHFGENGLDPKELASFPDYLVCVNAASLSSVENDKLTEILAAGLPIKILVQTDDILEASALGQGQLPQLTLGSRSKQLASVALGMNEVFVLQSPSSNLFQCRKQIQKGLDYAGPALFSVYSGAAGGAAAGRMPPYLAAAAAMSSRAFPAFCFDPAAGPDWASRFSLAENPQADLDWPVQEFAYEDEDLQIVSEQLPFTLVDFVACDRRYARHFARVPRAKWNGSLISVGDGLSREPGGFPDKIPCLQMIDAEDRLQKVIVDEQLIREARRCRAMWHSLQELGGIHNSHVENQRKAWQESLAGAAAPASAAAGQSAAAAPSEPAIASAAEPAQAEAAPSPDAPYIETARCSTCNECTQVNNKMFAYDGNQQAYIADPDAGTYAQLVEAAESCQVSIIHPGKPRNPNEPGLAELIARAQPFL